MDANTWLWILTGFLALIFLGTGILKLTTSRERLVEGGLGWAEDFSQETIRLLGVLEVLGAIGLVLPGLLDVAPVLVPISASCLAALMAGAVVVHVRRGELLARRDPRARPDRAARGRRRLPFRSPPALRRVRH